MIWSASFDSGSAGLFQNACASASNTTSCASTPARKYARCKTVVPLSSKSLPLVINSVGGNPAKSAYSGDNTGSFASVAPTYSASCTPGFGGSRCPASPFSANSAVESPAWLKSPKPEKIPVAPGSGNPSCFSFTVTSAVRIAPADVPYIAMCAGLYFFSNSLYTATASSRPAGNGCSGASRYSTAITFIPVKFAIGIVSVNDPESALNPPPCKLISTRSRFSAARSSDAMLSGVTTRTGTPAMVSAATFAGYIFFIASPAPACHLSVFARRSSNVSGTAASDCTRATTFCASGLIVPGTGTTRVTYAVPSAAIRLASVAGASPAVCAIPRPAPANVTTTPTTSQLLHPLIEKSSALRASLEPYQRREPNESQVSVHLFRRRIRGTHDTTAIAIAPRVRSRFWRDAHFATLVIRRRHNFELRVQKRLDDQHVAPRMIAQLRSGETPARA